MKCYRLYLNLDELINILESFKSAKRDFEGMLDSIITESDYAEGKYNSGFVDIENNMYFTLQDEFIGEFGFDLGVMAESKEVALKEALNFWEKEYGEIRNKTIEYLEECLSRLK